MSSRPPFSPPLSDLADAAEVGSGVAPLCLRLGHHDPARHQRDRRSKFQRGAGGQVSLFLWGGWTCPASVCEWKGEGHAPGTCPPGGYLSLILETHPPPKAPFPVLPQLSSITPFPCQPPPPSLLILLPPSFRLSGRVCPSSTPSRGCGTSPSRTTPWAPSCSGCTPRSPIHGS